MVSKDLFAAISCPLRLKSMSSLQTLHTVYT